MPAIAVPARDYFSRDVFAEGPTIFLDPSAQTLLSGDVTVLAHFIQFMSRDVLQQRIPASKIEIRGSVDPEDDTRQLIVRLWIHSLPSSEIRRYYQDFGDRVDQWAAGLPEEQRLDFLTHISFQARREADA